MKIVKAGYNYRHSSRFIVNRPNGSGDYLLLIFKTEAFLMQGSEQKTVPPSSVIIYKEGTHQHYGALDGKYINDWVHFDIDEEDKRVILELGIGFDTLISLYDTDELSKFVKSIVFEWHSENTYKEEAMKRYLELLLFKLSEKINVQSPVSQHPLYGQFYKLRSSIQLEPGEDWSIDVICKRIMLSRSYVQHLYKTFFGTSITNDIQSFRLEHAKYLLNVTDMTVTAISHSCGYTNDVHFMRIFKKVLGITPSEYRNKNKW